MAMGNLKNYIICRLGIEGLHMIDGIYIYIYMVTTRTRYTHMHNNS
jgi:hypothetical protein